MSVKARSTKERTTMLNKKRLFFPAALLCFMFLGACAANAQTSPCYTAASLQGTYAIVATYGANVALATGVRYFDGKGNMTGTFLINGPTAGSATGARTITSGTQVGTYTVNCDGTGVVYRALTTTTGTVVTTVDDLIITGATLIFDSTGNQVMRATNVVDAAEVPSTLVPGGLFVTRTYARRP
jgi:hypothetical protein